MASEKQPTPPPTPEPVAIEHEGKKYEGTFITGGGTISVTFGTVTNSTSFGSFKDRPLPLARTILREMVTGEREGKRATYVNLRVKTLEDYWSAVLVPNVRACIKDPTAPQAVFNAVISTWHLLDWAWHEENYGRDTRGNDAYNEYRDKLLSECPPLKWVSDLADAAKHCGLGRKTVSDGLVSLSLGGEVDTIFVMEPFDREANLGNLFPIQDVLKRVTDYWIWKLKGRNLPSPFV